jgi:hypothetical protein
MRSSQQPADDDGPAAATQGRRGRGWGAQVRVPLLLPQLPDVAGAGQAPYKRERQHTRLEATFFTAYLSGIVCVQHLELEVTLLLYDSLYLLDGVRGHRLRCKN